MASDRIKTRHMNRVLTVFVILLTLNTHYSLFGEIRTNIILSDSDDRLVHIREVYKEIDTFRLTIDIFYSSESFKRENNTAIVFFHGGGWAYGSPEEFFTTCERYAGMGIITFSVNYRLSIDNGVIPHKFISPIESVTDARSAMCWVRANAGDFILPPTK